MLVRGQSEANDLSAIHNSGFTGLSTKEIRRYSAIEELDKTGPNWLISRILIGKVKKVDSQKVQEVKIVYNCVGEIPEIAA